MIVDVWTKVDRYFEDHFVQNDPILSEVLKNSEENGLPSHNVSPCQGMLLHLLARIRSAERILEIGTLGGYSTIWLARALNDRGVVVTIEANEKHASVASKNFEVAGLQEKIVLLSKEAKLALQELIDKNTDPFDLIFIDSDKRNNPTYLNLSLKLSKVGTIIIGDNVVREGEVANGQSRDSQVIGVRQFCDALAKNIALTSTGIQTVGCKEYDGFTITIVEQRLSNYTDSHVSNHVMASLRQEKY
jgi:predicted O-methyltransferase YrrM